MAQDDDAEHLSLQTSFPKTKKHNQISLGENTMTYGTHNGNATYTGTVGFAKNITHDT
jgi:hypothetical protein